MDGLESGIQVGELDDRAIPLALPTSLRGRDGTRQPAREHSIPLPLLYAVFLAVQWHFLSTHLPVSCLREIGSERKGGSRDRQGLWCTVMTGVRCPSDVAPEAPFSSLHSRCIHTVAGQKLEAGVRSGRTKTSQLQGLGPDSSWKRRRDPYMSQEGT